MDCIQKRMGSKSETDSLHPESNALPPLDLGSGYSCRIPTQWLLCCRPGVTYVSDTLSQMTDNTNTPFPDVPWSDWQIDPRDLQIVQRPDGKDWLLGGGAFGQVRVLMTTS